MLPLLHWSDYPIMDATTNGVIPTGTINFQYGNMKDYINLEPIGLVIRERGP